MVARLILHGENDEITFQVLRLCFTVWQLHCGQRTTFATSPVIRRNQNAN